MSKMDDSKAFKYLMLLFKTSLAVLVLALLLALMDWFFLDDQFRGVIRPIGIAGLIGFGVGVISTLLLRNKL